jgi:hypothetical protein
MQHPGSPWQLTPEMQAALDAANARLAQLAEQHAPAKQSQISPQSARELVAWGKFKLKAPAAALLCDDLSAREYFDVLLANDCLADARRVLAHALPKRRALWWGVLAAYDACAQAPSADTAPIFKAVTQFVITPTEDLRRACGELAKRARPNSIARCLATAAYFSSGSVSPPGLPPVAPRPFVTGRLVGVGVYLASVTRSAALYKQYLREYLRWGQAIASGEMPLPVTQASAPTSSRPDAYWPERDSNPEEVLV